jgi:Trk K+ transport system NAD-binding subunit
VQAEQPGTLRERFGDLTPVAVVRAPAEGEEPFALVCPGRDLRVGREDTVWLFGTPAELHAQGVPTRQVRQAEAVAAPEMTGARAGHHNGPRSGTIEAAARSVLASLVRATDRRLRLALAALALLALASVIVLRLGYEETDGRRMSLLDALYFTVETVATVGYGDFNFREQPDWLRGFAIALMVLGAILATTFFAMLTNLLVSRRIEESLGQRRVTGLTDHVIVIGLGSVGVRVVEGLLAAGVDVVVVEPDENNRYAAQVRALGVPMVVADATLPRTLMDVKIDKARAVAILTSDDLTNLEAGLAARDQVGERRRGVPIVMRLLDRQLAHTVEHFFGFRFVRSTAALAAPWFVGAALGLEVLNTFYVGGRPLLLARLQVSHGLHLVAMSDLSAQLRVVALRRAGQGAHDAGRLEHPVRRTSRFHEGDAAYLIGPYEQLLALLRRNSQPPGPAGELFPGS